MEPWLSWTLALGIGSGLILYYKGTGKSAPRASPDAPASRRRQEKQQKQAGESNSDGAFSTSTETASTSKRKPQKQPQSAPKPKAAPSAPVPQQQVTEAADEPDDDKAWAEQLNAAQKGVNLSSAAKSKSGSNTKASKKKQRAEEVTDTADWPSDNVASTNETSAFERSSTNVSDMLEPSAPGPSVVRLTGEEKAKKQAPKKAEPEKETKKQRQNKRKAEEKKAAREQDEQERKALMENQRRAAREARGEPARNGVPSPAPASGAWTKAGGSKKETTGAQPTGDGQLLDTFDQEALSATSSNEPHTNATTPATTTSSLGVYDQSEEVQMEMVAQLNQNTGWNEVGKAKKGKKKAPVPEAESFEPVVKEMPRYSSAATDELVNGGAKAPGLPTKATKPSNSYDLLSYTAEYAPGTGPRHPQDSDWAA